jgi:hypothetical protein
MQHSFQKKSKRNQKCVEESFEAEENSIETLQASWKRDTGSSELFKSRQSWGEGKKLKLLIIQKENI